jgi:hypothetical protein
MVRTLIGLFALLILASPVRSQPEDPALDPQFEGQIAYFGNYTGVTSLPVEGRDAQRACPGRERRCGERIVGGGVKVVLSFAGERVSGFFLSVGGFTGPNGLAEGTLVGRRTSAGCELYQADGTMWQANVCGARGFRGTIASVAGTPKQAAIEFSTVGMYLRDAGAISRLAQEAAQRERRIDWLRNRLARGGPADAAFRLSVELDSYSRHYRGIDPDWLGDPVASGKPGRNRQWTLESRYAAQGTSGMVRATMLGDRVVCLAWDGGECLPIGDPAPFPTPDPADDDDGWLSRSPAPIAEPRPHRDR